MIRKWQYRFLENLGLTSQILTNALFSRGHKYTTDQLYESCRESLAWSPVSTITISVQKSGPNSRHRDLIMLGFLGFPPDNDCLVKCSSGPSITRSGPYITLQEYNDIIYVRKPFKCFNKKLALIFKYLNSRFDRSRILSTSFTLRS